jgi:hypothetical protein
MTEVVMLKLITGEVLLTTLLSDQNGEYTICSIFEIKDNNNPFTTHAKSIQYWIPIPYDVSINITKSSVLFKLNIQNIRSLSSAYESCVERVQKVKYDYNTTDMYKNVDVDDSDKELLTEEEQVTVVKPIEETNIVKFPKGDTVEYTSPNLSDTNKEKLGEFLKNHFNPTDAEKN